MVQIKNYQKDMAAMMAAVIDKAQKSERGYFCESFAVFGEGNISQFIQESESKYYPQPDEIKTDGKTRAKVLRALDGAHCYFEPCKMAAPCICDGRLCNLVEFDGVLYEFIKGWRESTSQVREWAQTIRPEDLPSGWEKLHPAPNKIGVVTDAKMQQWANYLRERRNAATEEKKRREQATKDILRNIAKMEKGAEKATRTEINTRGNISGRIIKNGLCYEWEILENGRLQDKITVYYSVGYDPKTYTSTAAADFMQMTKGQYKTRI